MHHSKHPGQAVDVIAVVAQVLKQELNTTPEIAAGLANQIHKSFDQFPVRSAIEESLRSKNPSIPDQGVTQIYENVKKIFVGSEPRHVYFLYFVISYILASGDYGSTRGDYLMRIVLNQVPEDSGFLKFMKRTFRIVSFMKLDSKP